MPGPSALYCDKCKKNCEPDNLCLCCAADRRRHQKVKPKVVQDVAAIEKLQMEIARRDQDIVSLQERLEAAMATTNTKDVNLYQDYRLIIDLIVSRAMIALDRDDHHMREGLKGIFSIANAASIRLTKMAEDGSKH